MVAKLIQIGNKDDFLITILPALMGFYFEIIHQYYTGKLVLGLGNGVTDGSVIMYALFVVSGIMGNDIFLHQV